MAAVAGDAELVSRREAIGTGAGPGDEPGDWSPSAQWRPSRRWVAVPLRYRRVVAGVAVVAGLSAAIGDTLATQAAQRAAARSSVSVMDAAYSPSADGDGLDLLVEVADNSASTVTVTQAQVQQSDLSLTYLGAPVDLAGHQQLEIVLWGQYSCSWSNPAGAGTGTSNAAGRQATTTLQLTVRNSQGNVNTLNLPLPASAQVPAPWQGGRAAFCTWSWGDQP